VIPGGVTLRGDAQNTSGGEGVVFSYIHPSRDLGRQSVLVVDGEDCAPSYRSITIENISTACKFPWDNPQTPNERSTAERGFFAHGYRYQPHSVRVRAGSVVLVQCTFEGTVAVEPREVVVPVPPRPSVPSCLPPRKQLACCKCHQTMLYCRCHGPKMIQVQTSAVLQDCTISNIYVSRRAPMELM
jgi:hypothetical protein